MKPDTCLTRIFLAVALAAAAAPAGAGYVLRIPLAHSTAAVPPAVPTYQLTAYDQANAPLTTGYAFGSVLAGESRDGTIRVTNTGTGSVTLASASLSGDAEFTNVAGATPCASGVALAAGASCYAYLRFQPTAEAGYTAGYSVTGNNGAAVTVSISGAGTTSVALNAYDTNGNALTGSVSFGTVLVGQVYAGEGWAGSIRNTGQGTAVIHGVTMIGSSAFSPKPGGIANCAEIPTLAAGASCNVYASFAPTTVDVHNGVYRLNAVSGQYGTVGLTGTAQALAPTIGALALPTGLDENSAAFTLTAPTSDGPGAWAYSSSNPEVATILNTTVTVTGAGSTTITATQAASGSYGAGSVSATLTIAPPAPVATTASCQTLLAADAGLGNGWYTFDPDGSGPAVAMSYYCDMTSDGGGWTRIVRQTEAEPVTNWNGGVNGASYALAQAQIPAHSHVAFGVNEQATAVDYVSMTYTTGNIEKTTTANPATGRVYSIARSSAGFYPYLDPNKGGLAHPCSSATSNGSWCGALSFTHGSNNVRWIFAPENNVDTKYRGYALQTTPVEPAQWRYGSADPEAWTVWVR